MKRVMVRAEGLGKEYRIGQNRNSHPTLRAALADMVRAPLLRLGNVFRGGGAHRRQESFWALKNVSFEVEEGSVLGVIGRNGAGKSTLLKLLSRITDPTEGWAEIHGRTGSLLEVGTGFHPELTGRDNIYLNGALLGMSQSLIRRKFDEIVAFSEIERFLDTPVKHYSSGMYMRLAFSIAAHLEPEVLIVDEVLAVGDVAFQKKCMGKMDTVSREGRTVLFVSHNMHAIQHLCRSALWLDEGLARLHGPTHVVTTEYVKHVAVLQDTPLSERADRQGEGGIRFTRVELRDAEGRAVGSFLSGQPAVLVVYFVNRSGAPLRNPCFGVGIDDPLSQRIAFLNNQMSADAPEVIPPGVQSVAFRVPRLPLVPGKYGYTLFGSINGVIMDWITNAGSFHVEGGDFYKSGRLQPASQGNFLMDYSFELGKAA